MTQEYLSNDRVVFADIDLSQDPAEKAALKLSPTGADLLIGMKETGGWPGHRYFNTLTGLDGKPYPRKTAEMKCHEMSDPKNMREYVEKAAGLRSAL
eukprot:COSAG02_NODE_100_length_36897_cov_9.681749_30_plen_97_part_00